MSCKNLGALFGPRHSNRDLVDVSQNIELNEENRNPVGKYFSEAGILSKYLDVVIEPTLEKLLRQKLKILGGLWPS